jgi:hypothetical protein
MCARPGSSLGMHMCVCVWNDRNISYDCLVLRIMIFSTLYTTLPHDKFKTRLKETIHQAFSHRNYGSKCVVTFEFSTCQINDRLRVKPVTMIGNKTILENVFLQNLNQYINDYKY